MSILTKSALRYPKSLWSHNPIPGGCVLYLPLWHPNLGGLKYKSIDPFGHTCTRTASGVLHFPSGADSSVDCGGLHDAATELWISLWFRLDTAFSSASATDVYLFGKHITSNDTLSSWLESSNGKLRLQLKTASTLRYDIYSAATSWEADVWHHVIVSLSSTVGGRLIANGAAAVTDADTNAAPGGGNLVFGDRIVGGTLGFVGEMREVVVGTDDLSGGEEAALYAGTLPGDETEYWPGDEGSGSTWNDQEGTADADGTIDSACTWENVPQHMRANGHYFDGFDDREVVPDTTAIQNIWDSGGTYCAWINPASDGLGSVGRIADKNGKWIIWLSADDGSDAEINFLCDFDGVADGQWGTDAKDIPLASWTFIAVTYDSGATTNNPTIYANTTARTVGGGLTEDATPVGTRVTDAGSDLYVGNDSTIAKSFDNLMGDHRGYNRAISAG